MEKLVYGECKAVTSHINKDNKSLSEFTTWREDIIEEVIKATCVKNFKVGDIITITITKDDYYSKAEGT